MSIHLVNADNVTAGVMDYAFREWALDSTETFGSVTEEWHEHYALIEVTREDITAMVAREGDPYLSANCTPGWYIVMTDEFGFVYGHSYTSEVMARRDFDALEWRVLTAEEN